MFNTAAGLAVIYTCMYAPGFSNAVANGIGYAIGITVSFALNKRWTFSDDARAAPQFARFLAVTGAAYCANLATMIFLTDTFHVNAYLAQALAILPYTAIGYLGSRLFVFRNMPI